MDGAELFGKSLAQATIVVKQVRPEHYANATPCDDWHVVDLLDHMLEELHTVPKLLAGETVMPKDDDEDGVAENVMSAADIELSNIWQAAADISEAASNEADPDELAHPAYGAVTNETYLYQIATDLLVHAWDLAVAIGMPIVFAPDSAVAAYDHAFSADRAMQPDDPDAVPINIDENAPPQIKLLALYGRPSNWHAAE